MLASIASQCNRLAAASVCFPLEPGYAGHRCDREDMTMADEAPTAASGTTDSNETLS